MLRLLNLSEKSLAKIKFHGHTELFVRDFDISIKSYAPGEWVLVSGFDKEKLAYINPTVEDRIPCLYLVETTSDELDPWSVIKNKIESAINFRMKFIDYKFNSRIFYGAEDGLNGLIIDGYENCILIQINTAGIDKFREKIKNLLEDLSKKETILLDDSSYRKKENLPDYNNNVSLKDLDVRENDLKFTVLASVMQKIGYYYDHRENRKHLCQILNQLEEKPNHALDLFCYVGSWGMNALKGGCKYVSFIDQGNFEENVTINLKNNKYEGRGEYVRGDVFSVLDGYISQGKFFDLIVSDPPSFTKNPSQVKQAIDGYIKLHRKILKLSKTNTILVFGSCTHYVSHDEFEKTIIEASTKEKKDLQLIYSGYQGIDHPIRKLNSRSLYLKCLIYIVR
jgi:23S rRNA (cytosine1962-C5)-methyltransferase